MRPTRWTIVGTAAALGVGTAVATASLGGISLADRDAGDGVVIPASTAQLPPVEASSGGPAAVASVPDPSPESADSPTGSALDSPAPAPARAVQAPAPAAPARVQAPAPAPVQPDSPASPASPVSAASAASADSAG